MDSARSSTTGGSAKHSGIDWQAAEQSPEFVELRRAKRSFVAPATIFFLGWYVAFILLAGYAPSFMGESLIEGFTVGYALALSQFVMVWVLTAMYLRRADRVFDPLAEKAVAKALEPRGSGNGSEDGAVVRKGAAR